MRVSIDSWPPKSAEEALEYLALVIQDASQSDAEAPDVIANCKVWAAETRRRAKAMRALEELTPNGSEFVGDVDACLEWIRKDRQHKWDAFKRYRKRAKVAEAAIEQANEKFQIS